MIKAQITVWSNPVTGLVTAEIPDGAGRRKIVLNENDPQSWGQILKDELDRANEWEKKVQEKEAKRQKELENHNREIRERKIAAENREREIRHRSVHDTSANRHGQGPEFAQEKFGSRNKNTKRHARHVFISDLLELTPAEARALNAKVHETKT